MFWYNGNLIEKSTLELAIDDPGLLYGATVFTTLRVYQQSLQHPLTNWNCHIDRLLTSLQALGWQQPNWDRIQLGAEELINHFPVLRITLFPDGREWITGRYLPTDLSQRQTQGITAWLATSQYQRILPEHKTGNYLPAWLALNKAKTCGAIEAILVDSSGNWLETSTGNLWGWKDGKWYTPPIACGILPGIGRKQLINWLESQNQPVQQTTWEPDWVKGLEAIAMTNSVVQVVPIHTIITQDTPLTYDPHHSSLQQLQTYWSY